MWIAIEIEIEIATAKNQLVPVQRVHPKTLERADAGTTRAASRRCPGMCLCQAKRSPSCHLEHCHYRCCCWACPRKERVARHTAPDQHPSCWSPHVCAPNCRHSRDARAEEETNPCQRYLTRVMPSQTQLILPSRWNPVDALGDTGVGTVGERAHRRGPSWTLYVYHSLAWLRGTSATVQCQRGGRLSFPWPILHCRHCCRRL